MNQGLREVRAQDLAAELEGVILPSLAGLLRSRGLGHCMRVSDLDRDLMVRLCQRLRGEVPTAQVFVLSDGRASALPPELAVTSTKLVELRNPLPDGTLRVPLLVFVPNETRASAEDSFGIATFEQVSHGDVYGRLGDALLAEVPNGLRAALGEVLRRLRATAWPFAEPLAVVRYLSTVKLNEFDPDAAGAALFELGLVPDFELFRDLARVPQRVSRNAECVRTLTWSAKSERGRVLDLGLSDRAFRTELANFLAEAGLEDVRAWTRKVVVQRGNWGLSFHRWKFDEADEEPDGIFVKAVGTSLPTVAEEEAGERLARIVGQQYLPVGVKGLKQFSVAFRAAPHPSKVTGLARFVAQVVAKDGGLVGLVKSVRVWKTAKDQASVTFSRLGKVDWEEGWHFVRIVPVTDDGDAIPLLDGDGNLLPWAMPGEEALPRPNETDLFYVLPDGEVEAEPEQRAVPRDASLVHAWLRLQFSALGDGRAPGDVAPREVRWKDRSAGGQGPGAELLEVSFGRDGLVHIPVSRQLKVLEQKTLSSPEAPLGWRLPIRLGQAGDSLEVGAAWPQVPEVAPFLGARAEYFRALRAGSKELVTQAAGLRELRSRVIAYAEAYGALVAALLRRAESAAGDEAARLLGDLRRVLALDAVTLDISDHRGSRREAALMGPTHPLRALWLVTWAELGDRWVRAAASAEAEDVGPTRDALLKLMAPVGFPPVLPVGVGRLLTAVDNLSPFWTLYAPSGEEDPRGLLGEVCAAFGLPEPGIGGAAIDGSYLASRLERYLLQHPYVRVLTLNAFNPGRATVLADALLELQGNPAFSGLRYDVRLFVPDPDALGVGEGLLELLSPTGTVTGKEADAFATAGESHLEPKLGLAVRSTAEFREAPDRHAAHVSFLFDVFPAQEVGAGPSGSLEGLAPVHGLFQAFHTTYFEDQHAVAWQRQPRHGVALELAGAEELTDLLSHLPGVLSNAAAAVATGQAGSDTRPVVTLALDPADRALIHHVHEVSDWVVTIDRNMGIEFFDHGGRPDRPDYLIDHSPDMTSEVGHRLVITSRSVAELEAMLGPVLAEYGLPDGDGRPVVLLDQLRSLSGRLALKLISSPTQRAEVLGLALSRLYLDYQGVFRNQVLVPLDAHLDLYRVLQRQGDELGAELCFKRTDLALFDLDAKTRTVTCRLVEVKCFSGVGDFAEYARLKARVAEQLGQSEQVLARHFDPHRTPRDRTDRPLKCRELSSFLEFYLDRGVRYGLMEPEAEKEAGALLGTLELGYRLAFTRSALVFDFEKPGTEEPEHESGVEYHRIGRDLIRELVDRAAAGREASRTLVGLPETQEPVTAARLEASVPRLGAAAFLAPERDRSAPWELAAVPRFVEGGEQREKPRATTEEVPLYKDTVEEPEELPLAADAPQTGGGPAAAEGKVGADGPAADHQDPGGVPRGTGEAKRGPAYDVMLGATSSSPQYGMLGEVSGRKLALDLNQTHTISLFGVQGGGKSYTLGSVVEMASLPIPGVNLLPKPLATIIFHYSPTQDYKPEFTSMVVANSDVSQVEALRERYGAEPRALQDLVLLAPEDKLEQRRQEYPSLAVHPLKFAAAELQASHWRFLMGAVGNQSTYIRQLNRIMRDNRNDLTLAAIRDGIDRSRLPDHLKDLAHQRLDLAAGYIDDSTRLGDLVRPGRLLVVDLRDEFIEKDEALGLFVVLLQLFAEARYQGEKFNKLVVFDEAHKYIESPDLVAGLIEVVREMRHKGTSILVASQDPPSVPVSLIELSSQIILHKFNSPAWLKHIQKANAALGGLAPDKMANLSAGEAYVWSSKASDEAFSRGAVKIRCRPRVTQHGGETKTAV